MDEDDAWAEEVAPGRTAHRRAVALVDDPSVLFSPDLGALEHDRGHDGFHEFIAWRQEHPDSTLGAFMRWTLDTWGAEIDDELLRDEVIAAQIQADDDMLLDFAQDVWVLDVSLLSGAFGQLVLEGRIDDDGKNAARFALRREQNPRLLERMYGPESRPIRAGILKKLAHLLEIA